MSKLSRNDPCFCGSGKKYKRCCLDKPNPAAHQQLPGQPLDFTVAMTSIDQLSNRIPDLIDSGQWGQAEQVCKELQQRFPDEIDWRERFAELYEAKGDAVKAAKYYRLAADFALSRQGFEAEYIAWLRGQADRLTTGGRSKAKGTST